MVDLRSSRMAINPEVESEAWLCVVLQSERSVPFELSARRTMKCAKEGVTMKFFNVQFVIVTKTYDEPASMCVALATMINNKRMRVNLGLDNGSSSETTREKVRSERSGCIRYSQMKKTDERRDRPSLWRPYMQCLGSLMLL